MLDTKNQGPQCTACGSPMTFTANEPSGLGQDLRTFTCPKCERVQRHRIDSGDWAWLEPRPITKSRLETPLLTMFG